MAGRAGLVYAFPPVPGTSLVAGRICWSLLFRISIGAVIGDRISVCDAIHECMNARARLIPRCRNRTCYDVFFSNRFPVIDVFKRKQHRGDNHAKTHADKTWNYILLITASKDSARTYYRFL